MKRISILASCVTLSSMLLACDGGGGETAEGDTTDPTAGGEEECDSEISGTIEADTTWACDHTLSGIVSVKNNAKLTIQPGVTIKGANGSALVIGKGSQLFAEGTADSADRVHLGPPRRLPRPR
jgi:hypothetical protein